MRGIRGELVKVENAKDDSIALRAYYENAQPVSMNEVPEEVVPEPVVFTGLSRQQKRNLKRHVEKLNRKQINKEMEGEKMERYLKYKKEKEKQIKTQKTSEENKTHGGGRKLDTGRSSVTVDNVGIGSATSCESSNEVRIQRGAYALRQL